MRGRKLWFLVAPVMALFLAVMAGAYLKIRVPNTAAPPGGAIEEEGAVLTLRGIDYVQSRDGRNEWRLKAEQASYGENENVTSFKRVHFVYYLDNREEIHLTGDAGEMNLESRSVTVRGNVRLAMPPRIDVETDLIFYDDRLKEIRSPDRVLIRSPGVLLTGLGMRASVLKRKLFLNQDVEARVSRGGIG